MYKLKLYERMFVHRFKSVCVRLLLINDINMTLLFSKLFSHFIYEIFFCGILTLLAAKLHFFLSCKIVLCAYSANIYFCPLYLGTHAYQFLNSL